MDYRDLSSWGDHLRTTFLPNKSQDGKSTIRPSEKGRKGLNINHDF